MLLHIAILLCAFASLSVGAPHNKSNGSDFPDNPVFVCKQFCVHCLNATNGMCDQNDRCCVQSDTQLERDFEQIFSLENTTNSEKEEKQNPLGCKQFCAQCMNSTGGLCDQSGQCCVAVTDAGLARDFERNNQSAAGFI